MFVFLDVPKTYEEALQSPDRKLWELAIKEALKKNDKRKICELPKGRKPISSKCVFRKKRDKNGKVDRCKARLAVRGYAQRYGIDYDERFARKRTKYIDVRYHFIREMNEKGMINISYVASKYQLADIFTKALSKGPFEKLRTELLIDSEYKTSGSVENTLE